MSRRSVNPTTFLLFLPILCLMIISCVKEHPPFDEYQVAGFTPIDSVETGRLLISNDMLYVIYDPTYSDSWSRIREYSLAEPDSPVIEDSLDIQPVSRYEYITHQDRFIFFHRYYGTHDNLSVIDLSTYEVANVVIPGIIYDAAYANDFIFISASDGFSVWQYSEMPSKVFHDSVHRNTGQIAVWDTVLLEVFRESDAVFKFWNISNPNQPLAIIQGPLPYQLQPIHSIALTGQNVFSFDYYDAVHHLAYTPGDSLYYIGALHVDYFDYAMTDTMIILINHDRFITANTDDLDTMVTMTFFFGPYYTNIIAVAAYEDRIFLLLRNKGIEIYERRPQ